VCSTNLAPETACFYLVAELAFPKGTRRLQLFLGDHWKSPVGELVHRIGDFRSDRSDRGDSAASTVADDMTVIGIENTKVVSRQRVANSGDV
jgi:hypothetical protein